MGSRKAKVLAIVVTCVVLAAAEVGLYLCFRLSRPFYLSTAAVLAATVLTLLLLLHCTAGRAERMATRRALDDGEELRVEYSFFRKVAGLPRKFSFQALAAATDDFQCVAGRGSSGTVFRGILDDGTQAPPPSDTIMVDLLALNDLARGVGPFGMPARAAGRAGVSSSVLSKGALDSFALSYLSGR
ncbi:hypothetical protein ACQ4PT_039038 [Festuca glaucescens]